jgi:hypothetical protein
MGDVAKEFFDVPLKHWEYKWIRKLTDEGIWNFLRSISFIHNLPADEKAVRVRVVVDLG